MATLRDFMQDLTKSDNIVLTGDPPACNGLSDDPEPVKLISMGSRASGRGYSAVTSDLTTR